MQKLFITKYLRSLHQQPAAFDIMTVGDDIGFHIPLFIHEQEEMLAFIIHDVFKHGLN
ncbi:hypothetical protein D3C80_1625360 [compost metagenome]